MLTLHRDKKSRRREPRRDGKILGDGNIAVLLIYTSTVVGGIGNLLQQHFAG